jgi:hypothetical protein
MKRLTLAITLALLLSSCAPSTSLRTSFTGRPSSDQVASLLETVVVRSGGSRFSCPYDLASDTDPRYGHVCAKVPGNFEAFQIAFEKNLLDTANETKGYVERLYDGWKRSNNFVYVGFFALNSREFNVVFGPNPDGNSATVVFEIDLIDR